MQFKSALARWMSQSMVREHPSLDSLEGSLEDTDVLNVLKGEQELESKHDGAWR